MRAARPIATQDSTVKAILKESGRPGKVPFRNGFVQLGERDDPQPGPLADIVKRGRDRALEQYALTVAWASSGPWDVGKDSRVWARAIGLAPDAAGRSAISRNWTYLSGAQLVTVERKKRLASVTLLREDGSGQAYRHHPFHDPKPAYFLLPFEYWTEGYFKELSLPAKAMLLIALSLPAGFPLPAERAPSWYGISETTARRGFRELRQKGLIAVEKEYKEAPLAPMGYTAVNFYTLQGPFSKLAPVVETDETDAEETD